jgi:hypothetical protein
MATRTKCSRVGVECIVGLLKSWCNRESFVDLLSLLAPIAAFAKTKAMPPIRTLLRFLSLAEVFVTAAPNLRVSFVDVYDAALEIHVEQPFLGGEPYKSARTVANHVLKALCWFRNVANFKDKRLIALRHGTAEENRQILNLCACVTSDTGAESTVQAGRVESLALVPFVRFGSPGTVDSTPSRDDMELDELFNDVCGEPFAVVEPRRPPAQLGVQFALAAHSSPSPPPARQNPFAAPVTRQNPFAVVAQS